MIYLFIIIYLFILSSTILFIFIIVYFTTFQYNLFLFL